MPIPELFTGKHDNETVRQFINAYGTYFKFISLKHEKIQALFAKSSLSDTLRTLFGSQIYGENTIQLKILIAHLVECFIPPDYSRCAHKNLRICKWATALL